MTSPCIEKRDRRGYRHQAEQSRMLPEIGNLEVLSQIVHIQVPRSFVNSLRCEDLWYSPSWKEYMWTSKRANA